MTFALIVLVVSIAVLIGLWLVSLIVEALRPVPKAPDTLRWAPDIPIRYIDVGNSRLRYVKAGQGPGLVLLHTLRTQLDLFEKVVPLLAERFTVYALDYPGHGYSDIPQARYDADFFARHVERFLEALDLRGVTLGGVSIGGTISLMLAGRRNGCVARVVAINPYDYDKGRGMACSSLPGWMVTATSNIPLLGETVMRLRTFAIMKAILEGGVADPQSISPALMKELYLAGNRPGHYRAFISLLRNSSSWEAANKAYRDIDIPVCLIWGDRDWARADERERDRHLIPRVEVKTIAQAGHFLPLDRPRELNDMIARFVGAG